MLCYALTRILIGPFGSSLEPFDALPADSFDAAAKGLASDHRHPLLPPRLIGIGFIFPRDRPGGAACGSVRPSLRHMSSRSRRRDAGQVDTRNEL
jgi:hypothetical protein